MITKTVRFVNVSGYHRNEYGLATIPFKKGEIFEKDLFPSPLRTGSSKLKSNFCLRPFGATWQDGSLRYAEAHVPLKLSPGEEKDVEIAIGENVLAQSPQFDFHPTILGFFNLFKQVVIGFEYSEHGEEPPYETLENWETIEKPSLTNSSRMVFKSIKRIKDLVVEMYLYVYNNQPIIPYELRIIGSNPATIKKIYPVNKLTFSTPYAYSGIYAYAAKGVKPNLTSKVAGSSWTLLSDTHLGDGQSQCYYGNILFPGNDAEVVKAAMEPTLWGVSLDWKESGAYGPFGIIPEPTSPSFAKIYADITAKYVTHKIYTTEEHSAWDDLPLGLTKVPSGTGDQRDFGMISCIEAVSAGRPEVLEMYRFNATEEAMRIGHFREITGAMVLGDNHPDWATWSGTTHWHPSISPDKLGKTDPYVPTDYHGWEGKDNQHWSSNLLGCTALLCNTYQLVDELKVEAELYIAGHTLPSMKPGWPTNNIDVEAPRGIGRSLNAMALNYLVTDNIDLRARIESRLEECLSQQWAGANTAPVRPMITIGPDGRQLPCDQWLPWNESLCAPGLEAWYQITDIKGFRDLAKINAINMVNWGWRLLRDPAGKILQYDVGNAVKWISTGTPIEPQQYFDTTKTYYNPSEIMASWTVTSLMLITRYYNDDLRAADTANQLLKLITAGRVEPFDRFMEWLV